MGCKEKEIRSLKLSVKRSFANLMDLCRLKNAELAKHLQNTRCSGAAKVKDEEGHRAVFTELYTQSYVLQLHRWQRQSRWTLSRSFLE